MRPTDNDVPRTSLTPATMCGGGWRRRADSNRRMGVLQTPALPLGYVALRFDMEREMGLEPTTFSLARRRSTSELLPHNIYLINADAIISEAAGG